MPPFEILFPAGAIGLYLLDCILLLYANELIFLRRAGRWRLAPVAALSIAGWRVCISNPLAPAVPQFRVRWSDTDRRGEMEQSADLERFLTALRPLQVLVVVMLVLLALLPVELALFGTGVELLALMGSFYLVDLIAVGVVIARRRDFGLSAGALAAVSFDALACAPFALNLVRKLCTRRSLAGNPILFAQSAFDPEALSAVLRAVCARVEEEQQREPGPTPRWHELEIYRTGLAARVPASRPDAS